MFKHFARLSGLVILLTGLVSTVQAPAALSFNISAATGGDGYTPIVYKNTAGETRIFSIFHHRTPSGTATPNSNVNCVIATLNTTCPGYPKYFSSLSGSSNSGPDDIYTSSLPHYAQNGSKLYYAAQRAADNGVACFDLESNTNCGYYQLGNLAAHSSGNPASVDGLERSGDRVFSFGADVQAYCLDLSTLTACSGQPYPVAGAPEGMPAYNGASLILPHESAAGRLYFAVNYSTASPASGARLTCFDPGTNARCSGWTSESVPTPSYEARSVFPTLNASGAATGICAAANPSDGPTCFDLSSNAVAAPADLFAGVTSSSGARVVEETTIGTKTYFAIYKSNSGAAVCYDWATSAHCSGFNSPHFWPTVNGGNTRDYGYTYYQKCMYGLGDAGYIWTFDPVTGHVGDTDCAAVLSGAIVPAGLPNTGGAGVRQPGWPPVLGLIPVFLLGVAIYGFKSKNHTQ
jgi:hypothetical protein